MACVPDLLCGVHHSHVGQRLVVAGETLNHLADNCHVESLHTPSDLSAFIFVSGLFSEHHNGGTWGHIDIQYKLCNHTSHWVDINYLKNFCSGAASSSDSASRVRACRPTARWSSPSCFSRQVSTIVRSAHDLITATRTNLPRNLRSNLFISGISDPMRELPDCVLLWILQIWSCLYLYYCP